MADATFNGTTMIITLPSGGMSHIVDMERDLYSAWKRWMVSDYQNQGYPPAFRTEGGFVTNPQVGTYSGKYFWINNIAGWRIRPAEEDSTIYFEGGTLLPESFDLTMISPPVGAYTVLIDGLQPVTTIAPGSVSAAQVWQYMMGTGNTAESEMVKARKAAQTMPHA
jgi:hypothetical protein